MVYRVIGLMSGSSLDGLDIAFVEFHENAGTWTYEIKETDCLAYSQDWVQKLKSATSLMAQDYQLLHVDYGHYIGQLVNGFIEKYQLNYQVALIASHGHTSFHIPSRKMTAQLGDGASIAAETQLPVVSDLRALDVALGGQGAPIVPVGERLLLGTYTWFLNLGGIANLSLNASRLEGATGPIAFDVCAANRVLNMLAAETGNPFDEGGKLAASGNLVGEMLDQLNGLDFYKQSFPKSLANDFGTDLIYPLLKSGIDNPADALRTYTEHIAFQVKRSIQMVMEKTANWKNEELPSRLLCTGGGAFNNFLVERLRDHLRELEIEVVVPDSKLVNYKEAMIMALIGILRWRQEFNVFSSVTGAQRDSIGGALWIGQEA
ncbi:MAG TPA: anhydro-N-acetylmuramic acid kinase [Chitinophagaceae bacterium]|nr:anhydro-N-acetylmuramic acid kinase [Chitinophagaceae bacterium]